MQDLTEILEMNFFNGICKLIRKSKEYKGNVSYMEETFFFEVECSKDGKKLKYKWTIVLEKYDSYKMIVISFYLTKHKKAKGIKKYKRNTGGDCINPRIVCMLFEECFNICTKREENKGYSFCFYALDDEYIPLEKKEDINKRMSAYYSFLERRIRLSKLELKLKQKGNILNNLYIGYNAEHCSEQNVKDFISFYEPIISEEIKYLYNRSSLKL